MKEVKILHLASFDGNLGDNANHNGVRYLWNKYVPGYDFKFTPLEMREFYWGWREFDDDFVDLVNSHDLFVCGGGNYFQLWVEKSPTGTSTAIPVSQLKKIKTPCMFYALGLDPHVGAPEVCVERFKKFLDYTLDSPNILTSVRNDGSVNSAYNVLGAEYADRIHFMPDGGHFVQVEDHFHPELDPAARTIGINLAGDMIEWRFGNEKRVSFEYFKETLSSVLEGILSKYEDVNLIFYPHIHKDYKMLSEFFKVFPDHLLRRRATVAPYLHGQGAEKYFFDIYRKCALNIGMRFHTNVCSFGLKVPSIGIMTHYQQVELYSYLGFPERSVRMDQGAFDEKMEALIIDSLENGEQVSNSYAIEMERVEKDAEKFLGVYRDWIAKVL